VQRNVLTGLAKKGLRAVALDFPGAGLTEKPGTALYDPYYLAGLPSELCDSLLLFLFTID
jgi:hypothetical protein